MLCVNTAGGERMSLTRLVFEKHDKDRNGTLNKKEFCDMVYSMGRLMDEQEREAAFTFIVLNGDGRITYGEFLAWWKHEDRWGLLTLTEEQLAALHQVAEVFRYYDTDRNGCLGRDEFSHCFNYLKESGYTIGARSQEDVMTEVDTGHDGNINYNEFISWMVTIGVLEVSGIKRVDLTQHQIEYFARKSFVEGQEILAEGGGEEAFGGSTLTSVTGEATTVTETAGALQAQGL